MTTFLYAPLLQPLQIGKLTIPNRFCAGPLTLPSVHGPFGEFSQDGLAYYEARAKGGVGLIITEVVTVEPTYTYLPGDMCCYDDTFIPGWEKLAAAVHEYGCKIMPQLFHPPTWPLTSRARRA